MIDHLFKSALSVREFKSHTDDNYADRLSRLYTVIISVSFAFIVTTKQFVGSPIHCWCPAQFTDSHRDYAESVCWVSNTYYLPIEQTIPGTRLPESSQIGYYQWVPMLLLSQALLAFLPCLLWRFICQRSGVNIAAIMDAALVTADASFLEVREKAVRYVVNQMDRYMVAQRDFGTGCSQQIKQFLSKICLLVGGREYGNYLIVGYLGIKLVYFVNAVSQIFLISSFVGPDYKLYGLQVLQRIYRRQDWTRSEHFPRETLCEFSIRDQSRVHQYVVQCSLAINLFNEKIFVFLWFWLVFVAIVTAVDFACWLFRAIYWPGQIHYIRCRLRAFDAVQRQPTVLARFAENYLRRDGMFIVRLIGLNVGDVAAGEVLVGLWNNYGPERRSIAERRRTATESKMYQNGAGLASPAGRADMV